MSCPMCESHINDAIRAIEGVSSVRSDRHRNETVVIAEKLDAEAVAGIIRGLGYDAEFISESEYSKKSFFSFLKR